MGTTAQAMHHLASAGCEKGVSQSHVDGGEERWERKLISVMQSKCISAQHGDGEQGLVVRLPDLCYTRSLLSWEQMSGKPLTPIS